MEIDLSSKTPDVRKLYDMKEVIFDKEWLKTAGNIELYYMYRGVKEKNGLRYDITVIPPNMLGSEFVKTKGHYHIGAWQELYTVLEGEAIYLLQKKYKNGEVEDVYSVNAKKGESVIMPHFYGHVTINPSKTHELKMANWVSEDCKSDYSDFEKLRGACYYRAREGWVKNSNYKNAPDLRFEKSLATIPKNLEFLKQG